MNDPAPAQPDPGSASRSAVSRAVDSIPAVVAYFDDPVLDADRQRGNRFESGWTQCLTRAYAEACAMPRTNYLVILDRSAGQHPPIMGAHVLDRVVLSVHIEHRDLSAIDVHHAMRAGGKHGSRGDRDPVRHDGVRREA